MAWLRSLTCVAVLCFASGCAGAAPAPVCPAQQPVAATRPSEDLNKLDQEQLARKLIDVTMGKELGEQVMIAMLETLRKLPGLPEGFIDRFRTNAQVVDLRDMVVPIYTKTYDRETMIAAITFYQSEQGHRLISKLPEVTRLSTAAGQRWGKQIAEQTLREMGMSPAPPPAAQ